MAVTVRRATLWSTNTGNTPGALARTLSPLAESGVNLDLVMGFSHPDKTQATIEVFPVEGSKDQRAARRTGFQKSGFPCVWVIGENRAGLGRGIAAALADAGINLNFFIAQVVRKEYVGMFSFEAESEADLAVKIIRKAVRGSTSTKKKAAKRKKKVTTKPAVRKKTAKKKKKTASRKKATAGRRKAG